MTKIPDIWMLHTTNPREGESQWGGCYIVEADAHNDAATMRKVTGLDWEVVPMVRADSLGKCLHQIAEPAEYPALPAHLMSIDQSDDDTFGALTDHAWGSGFSDGLALNAPMFTACQMRAYVDADRAQRAAAPQAVQPAVPVLSPDEAQQAARVEFEAWAEGNFFSIKRDAGGSNYRQHVTNHLWQSFQLGVALAATQPAAKGMDAQNLYYLQDARHHSMVGNCPSFWRPDGNGYTTNLDEAERLTFEEAMKQHKRRETDLPWLCAEVDKLRRPTVDCQYMPRSWDAQRAALAAKQGEPDGQ